MTVLIATMVIWLLVVPGAVVAIALALSTRGARRLQRSAQSYARAGSGVSAQILQLRPADAADSSAHATVTA